MTIDMDFIAVMIMLFLSGVIFLCIMKVFELILDLWDYYEFKRDQNFWEEDED